MSKVIPISALTSEWHSHKPGEKPPQCQLCRWNYSTFGFCADYYTPQTKIATLWAFPDNDSILDNKALSGGIGKMFLKHFVYPLGLRREEIGVSYILRCQPPLKKGRREYPTGSMKRNAENSCRCFDDSKYSNDNLILGGIRSWRPSVFIVSFDPNDVRDVGAYYRFLQRDMERALVLQKAGERPLVLMGAEALELVAPNLKGGVKHWRGHFGAMDGWKYNVEKPVTFIPASSL